VIKKAYCHPKKVGNFDVWVLGVLLAIALDIAQSMFKLSMKSNVVDAMAKTSDVNLVSHLSRILSASRVLSFSFPEYFKLARDS
jgi:predicted outer membrane lipoprotein